MQLLTSRSRRVGGDQRGATSRRRSAPTSTKAKALSAAAFGPVLTGYLVVAGLFALVTAMAPEKQFSAVDTLLAAGPGWLAAHQVPLLIVGQPLGVLPLLPTIGAALRVAQIARRTARRLDYREPKHAVTVAGSMAAAHSLLAATISAASDASQISSNFLPAFVLPGLIAGCAAAVGLARQCDLLGTHPLVLHPLVVRSLRAGALGLAALLACGAIVLVTSLVVSTSTVRNLFEGNAGGIGSGLGMLMLSVGYLPNAVLGAVAFVTGPGVSIGTATVGPFAFVPGPIPGLALLGGMPEQQAGWWPVLLLLPAAVGVLVGWSLRDVDRQPRVRLGAIGIAGLPIAVGCLVLGLLAGGRLAGGLFDPIDLAAGWVSVCAFGLLVVPGGVVAWLAGARPSPTHRATVQASDRQQSELANAPTLQPAAADDADQPAEADDAVHPGSAADHGQPEPSDRASAEGSELEDPEAPEEPATS